MPMIDNSRCVQLNVVTVLVIYRKQIEHFCFLFWKLTWIFGKTDGAQGHWVMVTLETKVSKREVILIYTSHFIIMR